MTTYIVRVQLSNSTPQNYTTLKNALLKAGFSKKIIAKDGSAYILPNGNYLGESDKPINKITNIVKVIALQIDKAPQILVTSQGEQGNSWIGLPRA